VGEEREIASFVGTNGIDLLSLHLKQFIAQKDIRTLQAQLPADIEEIDKTHQRFIDQFALKRNNEREVKLQVFALLSAITIGLFIFGAFIVHLRSKQREATYEDITRRLNVTAQAISQWETESFKSLLGDSNLSELERRAFSKVLNAEHELDAFRNQMDLYRKLYAMIGFEMRGITTTIKGGLRVLTKDTDDHGVFLAHEISLATDMLEELAENFNRLLSSGQAEGGENIDINALLANLGSSLSNKVRRLDGKMESYIDPKIPSVVFGNQIGVFWTLLFHFSNAITQMPGKSALLIVRCQSADSIDKIILHFELLFGKELKAPLEEVLQAKWKAGQNVGSNAVSQQLLRSDAQLSIQWFDSEERDNDTLSGARKLSVSLEATPKTYPDNEELLEGKRVLLCGDSPLQLDLISRTISESGCGLEWASSPNDIFKASAKAQNYDAFIVTDTVPGIELKSFCKTLKSRLTKMKGNTRLLLSVADPDLVEDTYQYVDHIFYRPSDNKSFLTKLTQQLTQEGDENSVIEERILVVEDDQIQQIILVQLLEEFGIACDTASSGEEALEYLKDNKPAIVFMDCIMPGMGGIEATRQIRAQGEQFAGITVIGATALTSNKDKKECMDAGMDYIIGKPYKNEEIYKVIKNYMAVQKIS
jgi:CheY-like chemotaxis protein/signal transduction histidine kinase